jgi:hypothetical protein
MAIVVHPVVVATGPVCHADPPSEETMSRIPKMLITVVAGAAFLTASGAAPAPAQEEVPDSPRTTGMPSEDVPVVYDQGLAAGTLRVDSAVDSAAALQTCFGGAKPWTVGANPATDRYIPSYGDGPDTFVGRVPVWVASPRCNDVNIRITSARSTAERLRVCFFPSNAAYFCNQWTTIAATDTAWHVVASRVLDRTRFEIQFENPPQLAGQVAY